MKYLSINAVPQHCLMEVCQNCESHKNKPSRCVGVNGTLTDYFVNRKARACGMFTNKHTGMSRMEG